MDRVLRALRAFIFDDPFVRSKYLVFVEVTPGCIAGSVNSQVLFCLWFIVHGRNGYNVPVVIPQVIREFVTASSSGPHMLMQYAADQERIESAGEALKDWYYAHGLRRRRLGPFLGQAELVGRDGGRSADRSAHHEPATASAGSELAERLALLSRGAIEHGDGERVSIVGYHKTVLGIGEDARCLFECLCEIGVPAELVDVSPPGLERLPDLDRFAAFEAERPTAPVVIFCLPAIEMIWAITDLALNRPGPQQYRIGYWPWETSVFPPSWSHVYDQIDEVWASTRFLNTAFSGGTTKPVIDMPLHVDAGQTGTPNGFDDLLGSQFTVLTVFDFNSHIERKNPLGAIEAFKRAFPAAMRDVRLILKALHGSTRPDDVGTVVEAIGGDDRIVLRDVAVPKPALNGLIARSDVYLALHRAEGFGRPIAEAMLLGTPVIATGWSGCADFLRDDTGFPVRSTLRPVAPHEYPFAAGLWAEPDLDHAASLLRQAHAAPHERRARVAAAHDVVQAYAGLRPVAQRLHRRLAAITAHLQGNTAQAVERPDDGRSGLHERR